MNLVYREMVMLQKKGSTLQTRIIDEQIDAAQAFCAPLLGEGAVDEFISERRREAEGELG
jgi:hypothetical protein